MASVRIDVELCGPNWLGQVIGPRGGRQIKAPNLTEALKQIKAAAVQLGAPLPPSAPIEPPKPLPQPSPRLPREVRRTRKVA